MLEDFTIEARRITQRLGELDQQRVAFGSRGHDYRFAPRLDESAVLEFERRYNLQLPSDYRSFLTKLGNGGAGPHYGVPPLSGSDAVARCFEHTAEFELGEDELDDPLPGCVTVAECGCGIYVVLVVKGPAFGQVWWDTRWEQGIAPVDMDGPQSFSSWWLANMRAVLDRFERSRR